MIGGFTTTITILRARTVMGRYASEGSLDWTNPDRIAVDFPVTVQPLSSSEGDVDRPSTTTGWQLITPPGRDLPLGPHDRVELAMGGVYSVDGEVLRFPHPRRMNTVHHIEVMLELVVG